MCGIAGLIRKDGCDFAPDRMLAGFDRLRHRGPDDVGFLSFARREVEVGREWTGCADPEVVLFHRRLSILDLSEGGWQPMASADGRYYVVFNGEIYNFVELRRDLATYGHTFHTNSDTEVLLAAFHQWGIDALRRFIGMFAIALFDKRLRKLTLARDFFGIKPLYYTVNPECFAFASEVKALLELSGVSREVNPDVLLTYLRYGICDHGPETLFENIRQLPPAHYLEVSLDDSWDVEPIPYWRPEINEQSDLTFDEAADRLREMFLQNIRLHLRSDVPVGAALSGGIDSSAVVMAMRHVAPDLDLNTFSFIADDAELSEEQWVDVIGQRARAKVHKVRVRPQDLVCDIDRLTCQQDWPLISTSPYVQYRVMRRAREAGITVMLDGQGADEMLGGYRYYMGARLATLIRAGDFGAARRFLSKCAQWPGASRSSLLLRAGNYLLPSRFRPLMRKLVGKDVMPSWINAQWFLERGVQPRTLEPESDTSVLRNELLQEISSTSLPQLLRYEDRNSMAFSIESRVPFLTPELASFVLSLPEEYIISDDGTSKAVFRRAMRGIVPDCILDRRDKIGFATPERAWMLELRGWVSNLLASDVAKNTPFLNASTIGSEWDRITKSNSTPDSRVWRWINILKWSQQFQAEFI